MKTKGDKVQVFQKFRTREDFEGFAILKKRVPSVRDSDECQNWNVEFESDGFVTDRLINVIDLKNDVLKRKATIDFTEFEQTDYSHVENPLKASYAGGFRKAVDLFSQSIQNTDWDQDMQQREGESDASYISRLKGFLVDALMSNRGYMCCMKDL
jgi:hypothetical protein